MKKSIYCLSFLIAMVVVQAMAQTPVLKYNDRGIFKIAQFTDVHFNVGVEKSQASINLIAKVLDAEKPQLVIFTGDIVTSKPVLAGWDEVLKPIIERKIPWAVVFGNHDDENGVSRTEIMEHLSPKPYRMSHDGPESVTGIGNYVLEINGNTESDKLLLYCMDSRAYSSVDSLKGYGWFSFDQIAWYREQSKLYAKTNADKPLPALAFFHIPLNEYSLLSTTHPSLIGTRTEKECHGAINSGMYAAMLECGDVMGTFVGHDHDNDYIGMLNNICLAYGRFSGTATTYTNLQHGSRIIEVQAGKRTFKTWIRLADNNVINIVQYPQTFTKKK